MRALTLFALCGLAIAQPLLDLLARYAELFVARRSGPLEIAALPFALILVPPLLLGAIGWLAGRASRRLGRWTHLASVALLVAAIALPPLDSTGMLGPAATLGVALGLGALGAWLYEAFAGVRATVSLLALAPLVFVAVFFASAPIRATLFESAQGALEEAPIGRPAPIVFVVFDELPLASLQDAAGAIDATRYPGFARLAATSTWLRNATTVESRTLQAIPAIVTGRYPAAERRLPLASQHPGTLFELLQGQYHLNVIEALTHLRDSPASDQEPALARWRGLLRDISLLYVHVLLPERLTRGLPSVQESWRDFEAGQPGPRRSKQFLRGRPLHFRRFVQALRASNAPSLDFIHAVLPHGPWQYLPSGASFHPFRNYGRLLGYWSEEPYFAIEGYRRHLLQVELVDRLLEELLDRLVEIGTFDETLLVVVADHGASFWPGDHYRDFEKGDHPADILTVPLFIKRPGQAEGDIDQRNVETIDIVPTILDVIDREIPADVDGCSVFDPRCPDRAEKIAFRAGGGGRRENVRHTFDAQLALDDSGLRRRLELLAAHGPPDQPYRGGLYSGWIGRSLTEATVAPDSAGVAKLEGGVRTWQIERSETLVPARVVGLLDLEWSPESPPEIALVRDGRIETIVPAPMDEAGRRLVALLPGVDPAAAAAPIRLYLVTGPSDAPRLQALTSRVP